MNIIGALADLARINPKRSPLVFASKVADLIGDVAASAAGVPVDRDPGTGELIDADQNDRLAALERRVAELEDARASIGP